MSGLSNFVQSSTRVANFAKSLITSSKSITKQPYPPSTPYSSFLLPTCHFSTSFSHGNSSSFGGRNGENDTNDVESKDTNEISEEEDTAALFNPDIPDPITLLKLQSEYEILKSENDKNNKNFMKNFSFDLNETEESQKQFLHNFGPKTNDFIKDDRFVAIKDKDKIFTFDDLPLDLDDFYSWDRPKTISKEMFKNLNINTKLMVTKYEGLLRLIRNERKLERIQKMRPPKKKDLLMLISEVKRLNKSRGKIMNAYMGPVPSVGDFMKELNDILDETRDTPTSRIADHVNDPFLQHLHDLSFAEYISTNRLKLLPNPLPIEQQPPLDFDLDPFKTKEQLAEEMADEAVEEAAATGRGVEDNGGTMEEHKKLSALFLNEESGREYIREELRKEEPFDGHDYSHAQYLDENGEKPLNLKKIFRKEIQQKEDEKTAEKIIEQVLKENSMDMQEFDKMDENEQYNHTPPLNTSAVDPSSTSTPLPPPSSSTPISSSPSTFSTTPTSSSSSLPPSTSTSVGRSKQFYVLPDPIKFDLDEEEEEEELKRHEEQEIAEMEAEEEERESMAKEELLAKQEVKDRKKKNKKEIEKKKEQEEPTVAPIEDDEDASGAKDDEIISRLDTEKESKLDDEGELREARQILNPSILVRDYIDGNGRVVEYEISEDEHDPLYEARIFNEKFEGLKNFFRSTPELIQYLDFMESTRKVLSEGKKRKIDLIQMKKDFDNMDRYKFNKKYPLFAGKFEFKLLSENEFEKRRRIIIKEKVKTLTQMNKKIHPLLADQHFEIIEAEKEEKENIIIANKGIGKELEAQGIKDSLTTKQEKDDDEKEKQKLIDQLKAEDEKELSEKPSKYSTLKLTKEDEETLDGFFKISPWRQRLSNKIYYHMNSQQKDEALYNMRLKQIEILETLHAISERQSTSPLAHFQKDPIDQYTIDQHDPKRFTQLDGAYWNQSRHDFDQRSTVERERGYERSLTLKNRLREQLSQGIINSPQRKKLELLQTIKNQSPLEFKQMDQEEQFKQFLKSSKRREEILNNNSNQINSSSSTLEIEDDDSSTAAEDEKLLINVNHPIIAQLRRQRDFDISKIDEQLSSFRLELVATRKKKKDVRKQKNRRKECKLKIISLEKKIANLLETRGKIKIKFKENAIQITKNDGNLEQKDFKQMNSYGFNNISNEQIAKSFSSPLPSIKDSSNIDDSSNLDETNQFINEMNVEQSNDLSDVDQRNLENFRNATPYQLARYLATLQQKHEIQHLSRILRGEYNIHDTKVRQLLKKYAAVHGPDEIVETDMGEEDDKEDEKELEEERQLDQHEEEYEKDMEEEERELEGQEKENENHDEIGDAENYDQNEDKKSKKDKVSNKEDNVVDGEFDEKNVIDELKDEDNEDVHLYVKRKGKQKEKELSLLGNEVEDELEEDSEKELNETSRPTADDIVGDLDKFDEYFEDYEIDEEDSENSKMLTQERNSLVLQIKKDIEKPQEQRDLDGIKEKIQQILSLEDQISSYDIEMEKQAIQKELEKNENSNEQRQINEIEREIQEKLSNPNETQNFPETQRGRRKLIKSIEQLFDKNENNKTQFSFNSLLISNDHPSDRTLDLLEEMILIENKQLNINEKQQNLNENNENGQYKSLNENKFSGVESSSNEDFLVVKSLLAELGENEEFVEYYHELIQTLRIQYYQWEKIEQFKNQKKTLPPALRYFKSQMNKMGHQQFPFDENEVQLLLKDQIYNYYQLFAQDQKNNSNLLNKEIHDLNSKILKHFNRQISSSKINNGNSINRRNTNSNDDDENSFTKSMKQLDFQLQELNEMEKQLPLNANNNNDKQQQNNQKIQENQIENF